MRAMEETLLGGDGSALFDALSFRKHKHILVATVIKVVLFVRISHGIISNVVFFPP